MEYGNKSVITKNTRFVFLDFLRIFAFLSVLIGHKFYEAALNLASDTTLHSTIRTIVNLLLPIFYGGGAGVVVFFLVSGYIITHVLQTEKTDEFLIKRIFRIYPLYIVAVLIQYVLLTITDSNPDPLTLLAQLTLAGDIFGTHYALDGVEWTLRAELLFYIFMTIASALKITTNYIRFLPYFYLSIVLVSGFFAPIPAAEIWSKGYLTMYGPFLFLGSMFYLFEKKIVNLTTFLIFIGLIFYQHFHLISLYQKPYLNTNFTILAFFIFVISFACRNFITAAPWILLLSDMTYSIYLFHKWLFEYIKDFIAYPGMPIISVDIQALIILFPICFLMMKFVEKPAIRLGRRIVSHKQKNNNNYRNPNYSIKYD